MTTRSHIPRAGTAPRAAPAEPAAEESSSATPTSPASPDCAVIFDLDGVLTDTAELHFQSWLELAAELAIPFDRAANDALRGLSRPDSLRLFLGAHAEWFTPEQQLEIMERKNQAYLARVARMTPADVLPGARELLLDLRRRGVRVALASSSKNARFVLARIALEGLLDVVVDGWEVPASKPSPEVFIRAAQRVGVPPSRCVVIEDAESGIDGAHAAGMKCVGVGPPARVARADLVVPRLSALASEDLLGVLRP